MTDYLTYIKNLDLKNIASTESNMTANKGKAITVV